MRAIQLINVNGNLQTQDGPIGGSNNFQSYSTNYFSGCMQSVNPTAYNSNNVNGNITKALGTSPFTISFWIYPDQENYGHQDIFGIGDTSQNRLGLQLVPNSGTFKLNIEFGLSNQTTTTTIEALAWSHVLITRDADNKITLFINGIMSYQSSTSVNFNSPLLNLFVYSQGIGMRGKITGFSLSQNVWITANFTPNAHPINNDTSMLVILNADSSEDLLVDSSSYTIVLTSTNIEYGTDYPKVKTSMM